MKKGALIGGGLIILLSTIFFIFMNMNKTATEATQGSLISASGADVLRLTKESQDGIVYIGRPTCDKCQAFQPKLEKAVAKNKQDVFYYNTDDGKKADLKTFEKIVAVTDIQSVPAVLVIKNGKVSERLTNFKNQEEINQFLLENK